MIQKERSFENQLINLFWGLTRGSRLLKPYSSEFKRMGFKIVGLELVFQTRHNQKATPDMVMQSVKLQESIITEWTQEKTLSNRKVEQLKKYVIIDEDSLRTFVSEVCVNNKDVILIVTPEGESDFKQFLINYNLPIILLTYTYDGAYILEKKLNEFSVKETENFFNQQLTFNRIYYSFPDINLSNLSKSLFVDNVISTLIEILVKEDEGFEFNIENFTKRMLALSFYNLLSPKKRSKIAKVSKEILKDLSRRRYLEGILKRTKEDPPTWKIILPKNEKFRRIKTIKRKLEEFADMIAGRSYQPSLFDQLETGGDL